MVALGRCSLSRRALLRAGVAGAVATRLPVGASEGSAAANAATVRPWVGPGFWANRLQDWQQSSGRLECISSKPFGRSLGVLTTELQAGQQAASIQVRTGTLAHAGGFSAVVLGTAPSTSYQGRALVQAASGTGGGLMCCYESDGQVRFREHGNEAQQLAFAVQTPGSQAWAGIARRAGDDVTLRVALSPQADGSFTVTTTATDTASGAARASAVLRNVPAATVTGGVSLFSTEFPRGTGARYWFRDLTFSGPKAATRPERALGPVLGTLWSLSGSVLKLTAQLFPIAAADPQQVRLDYRLPGGTWVQGPLSTIGPGYTALFRVTGWDASRDWQYRVVYAAGTAIAGEYGGTIRRDPTTASSVAIAVINCSIHSYRPLDAPSRLKGPLRNERPLGLYTPENLYFPYSEVVTGVRQAGANLLAVLGDQFYEHRPTETDPSSSPTLDYLYRWYLWLWAFRDLTRDTPAIVLIDDHDVYQSNLWGHGGEAALDGNYRHGGYVHTAAWVNMVQRVQCGHNPDPYDATPVRQGISVYYGALRFGGISLAWVEDRKFKTGDKDNRDSRGVAYPVTALELLGARQEAFLNAWSRSDPGTPKVCLTQTLWACLKTGADGLLHADTDSGGYPAAARARALRLVKQAGGVILCGDQHLGSLVRHGLNTYTDGPMQFTAPAVGTAWQRWFEPSAALPDSEATRYTGNVTDAYGNRMHVHAVANPLVSFATYQAAYGTSTQNLGDRSLKREGYGVLRIDKTTREFVFECWPYDARPATNTGQYPGWPYRLPWASA